MPCDQCQAYHDLGYDTCLACVPAPGDRLPPATPLALLLDLEDQLRRCEMDGGRMERYQLAVWITLTKLARERLQEEIEYNAPALEHCPLCDAVRVPARYTEESWRLHVLGCRAQSEEDREWTLEETKKRRDAWDAWVYVQPGKISQEQLALRALQLGYDLATIRRQVRRHRL